jgi:hypothetical protein
MNINCCILSWNVRGLNDPAKRESVKQLILSSGATIVCLQETKIMSWNSNLLKETLGCKLATQSTYLPSLGASGGILFVICQGLLPPMRCGVGPYRSLWPST